MLYRWKLYNTINLLYLNTKKPKFPTSQSIMPISALLLLTLYKTHSSQKVLGRLSSVQLLSRVRLFVTPWITAHQASLSINNSRVHPNPYPLSRWCDPNISPSIVSFSAHPQSFPASGSCLMSQLSTSGSQSIGVSASTSALPMNTQDWSPCSPMDSQEASPTWHFKSVNSLVLSFLYSPPLTSIHDYWKKHGLD